MEVDKRKRRDEAEVDYKKVKGSTKEAENGEATAATKAVDDGEVEEFYTILRRIHVAVKYFKKGTGRNEKNVAATPWSPNFEREDFDAVAGVKRPETVEENVGFDLNAEPEPSAT